LLLLYRSSQQTVLPAAEPAVDALSKEYLDLSSRKSFRAKLNRLFFRSAD